MLKNKPKRIIKKRVCKKRGTVKKEFVLPLYFGWEIVVRRVNDLRKHIVWPFKKYWQQTLAGVFLLVLTGSGIWLADYFLVKAATFYWTQNDWITQSSDPANHTSNKTGWVKYSAKDDNLSTGANLSLSLASDSQTQTSDDDFNAGDTSDNIYVGSNTVYPQKPDTYACENNDDNICQSGRCDETCQAKLAGGQACDEASDCDSGYCQDLVCVPSCDASTACETFCLHGGLIYGTVSANGGCWLDRNLGATAVATAYNTAAAYGDLYQWGRLTDGHQIRTSGATDTNSSIDVPGHANFITEGLWPYDWRAPQNNNLWGSAGGYLNNPCPTGWHVPVRTEWASVVSALGITNRVTAASSVLHLPAAGGRDTHNASLYNADSFGYYWSSTILNSYAYFLYFNSSNVNPAYNSGRAFGYSVRCLKN